MNPSPDDAQHAEPIQNAPNDANGGPQPLGQPEEEKKEAIKAETPPPRLLKCGMIAHHEIQNFTIKESEINDAAQPQTWSNCDATSFSVRRGPNYVSGQKSPSKKALYTIFAADAYKLPTKMHKIWRYVDIDSHINSYTATHQYTYDGASCSLPPLFVINFMIPNYPPELMGGKSDGEGMSIVMYAHLSAETRQELQQGGAKRPSIDLLKAFIHSDLVHSEIRNRFKCIARVMNPSHTDFGFLANRLVRRYNGKPFLARTSSTFYHEPGRYFGADIDVHVFGYPARQGLSYVKGTIQTAIYDIGFTIEGHSDEQLPEQILACCRISKIGTDVCKSFPEDLYRHHHRHSAHMQGLREAQDAEKEPEKEPEMPANIHKAKSETSLLRNGTHDKAAAAAQPKAVAKTMSCQTLPMAGNNGQHGQAQTEPQSAPATKPDKGDGKAQNGKSWGLSGFGLFG